MLAQTGVRNPDFSKVIERNPKLLILATREKNTLAKYLSKSL